MLVVCCFRYGAYCAIAPHPIELSAVLSLYTNARRRQPSVADFGGARYEGQWHPILHPSGSRAPECHGIHGSSLGHTAQVGRSSSVTAPARERKQIRPSRAHSATQRQLEQILQSLVSTWTQGALIYLHA
jgi:hypothetical protein